MKNNTVFLAIILCIFSLVFMVLLKAKVRLTSAPAATAHVASESTYKIAIMLPVTHPALEEISQGFIDTLQRVLPVHVDTFNAQGDRTLMRSQAEEVVARGYDLIFTIATAPAVIIKEVCDQRGKYIPVVAGAVDSPVETGIIQSMESSGNNIVAVTGTDDFEQQIDVLQFLKPTVKSILLVYNSTPGLEKKRSKVEMSCRKRGIAVRSIAIFNMNDLIQKVPNFIQEHDTVFVLKDNMVVSGIESLVTLCNKTGTTLYASDLNSADKGAALAFGVREYDDGVLSARKALEILQDHKKPSEIASELNVAFRIKVNSQTMQQQDLDLSDELLFVMKSGDVV